MIIKIHMWLFGENMSIHFAWGIYLKVKFLGSTCHIFSPHFTSEGWLPSPVHALQVLHHWLQHQPPFDSLYGARISVTCPLWSWTCSLLAWASQATEITELSYTNFRSIFHFLEIGEIPKGNVLKLNLADVNGWT